MAWDVAQAIKIETSSGTSVTGTAAMTFAAGSLAVAAIAAFQGTAANFACSDSANGAYTGLTSRDFGDPGIRLTYHPDVNAGTVDLTANAGAGASGVVGIWHEVTDAHRTTPFTTGEENGIAAGATTSPDSQAITNTENPDSIFFAALANGDGGNPITYTINASGSEGTWIEKDATHSKELNGGSFPACGVVYQIVTSSASRSHTWTTASFGYAAVVAVFQRASLKRWILGSH
jgi:hypothetical protein